MAKIFCEEKVPLTGLQAKSCWFWEILYLKWHIWEVFQFSTNHPRATCKCKWSYCTCTVWWTSVNCPVHVQSDRNLFPSNCSNTCWRMEKWGWDFRERWEGGVGAQDLYTYNRWFFIYMVITQRTRFPPGWWCCKFSLSTSLMSNYLWQNRIE